MKGEAPEELPDDLIATAIRDSFGLDIGEPVYFPQGAGGYLWVVRTGEGDRYIAHVDDLDAKPWISGDRESAARGLDRAYSTAARLFDKAKLEWVVGPIQTSEGNVVVSLTPRYCCALFPFVDGTAGSFGDVLTNKQRHERLGLLAQLHQATDTVRDVAPSLTRGVAGRHTIDDALADLGSPWDTGPLAETARLLLVSHEREVKGVLDAFERERERVRTEDVRMVVTHGEPHPGNFMQGDRCLLIDWDTVGLAPAERDLWMFDDGTGTAFDGYAQQTGYRVDWHRISLYRMMWTLSDIAAFTADLRAPHGDTVNARFSMWGLEHAVTGTASPPYRFPG